MIKTRTVLIPGAGGASMPYGYPSGKELKRIICGRLKDSESELSRILRRLRHEPGKVAEFGEPLSHSGKDSADAF